MPYTVLLRPAAGRDLKKLSSNLHSRVVDVLFSLEQNPRRPGVSKLTGSLNLWRIRLGDYRILFEIDDSAETVLIFRIAHRREVYR